MHEIQLPPNAAPLIESLRDIGYSFETAIADVIDNAISAMANNIVIAFSSNIDLQVAIIDDGKGMSKEELQHAMQLGSKNPLSERSIDDLGRFV